MKNAKESGGNQVSSESDRIRVIAKVGRQGDGKVFVLFNDGETSVNQQIVDMMRQALLIADQLFQDNREVKGKKVSNWLPGKVVCPCCGSTSELKEDPEAYIVHCPQCDKLILVEPDDLLTRRRKYV